MTTASPEQIVDVVANASLLGFEISTGLQPRRRHRKPPEEPTAQATIDAIKICLGCGSLPVCRDATITTGEAPKPNNYTCHAVRYNLPLVFVKQ